MVALYVLGSLLIVLNLISWIRLGFKPSSLPKETINAIAYYIGYSGFLFIGIALLFIVRFIRRSIQRKQLKQVVESLPR